MNGGSGATLNVGGAALTSNGTVISMASGGLVVGGLTTVPVSVPASSSGISTSAGLGGVIMSGFGRGGNSTMPEVFEGGAAVRKSFFRRSVVIGGVEPGVRSRRGTGFFWRMTSDGIVNVRT